MISDNAKVLCVESVGHLQKGNVIDLSWCDVATMICVEDNEDCFVEIKKEEAENARQK